MHRGAGRGSSGFRAENDRKRPASTTCFHAGKQRNRHEGNGAARAIQVGLINSRALCNGRSNRTTHRRTQRDLLQSLDATVGYSRAAPFLIFRHAD